MSTIDDVIRQIVREEIAVWATEGRTMKTAVAVSKSVGSWQRVPEFFITSGRKNYVVRAGYPVGVLGEGKGGGIGRGYKVIAIDYNVVTGQFNIEVRRGSTHSRIFRSDKIVYMRPPKIN